MSRPRYSIIPGGAVTDPRLEGRDLQVLCLLGRHADKRGWCYRSQVKMAAELKIARSTLQLSLSRLVKAGWIIKRTSEISKNTRPHACYEYRVIMDGDDLEVGPSKETKGQEKGADHSAPLPLVDRHRGADACTGTECPKSEDLDDDSCVRETLPFDLTSEIAVIAGIADKAAWPPGWVNAAYRVQAFLRAGYKPDDLRNGARAAMASKRDGIAPYSIEYFAKPWAKARAQREKPVPPVLPLEQPQSNSNGVPRPGSREDRQERTANALRKLHEFAHGSHSNGSAASGTASGAISGGVCLPKPPES